MLRCRMPAAAAALALLTGLWNTSFPGLAGVAAGAAIFWCERWKQARRRGEERLLRQRAAESACEAPSCSPRPLPLSLSLSPTHTLVACCAARRRIMRSSGRGGVRRRDGAHHAADESRSIEGCEPTRTHSADRSRETQGDASPHSSSPRRRSAASRARAGRRDGGLTKRRHAAQRSSEAQRGEGKAEREHSDAHYSGE